MNYENERSFSLREAVQRVSTEKLISGHQLSREFFAEAQQESGTEEWPVNVEWRDTPPPIFYDDEFGRAVVSFERANTGRTAMPVFFMKYEEDGGSLVCLDGHMGEQFYFAQTIGGFSTLSVLGDPVVFFNYDLLASSRKFLLALGHEMGHTKQDRVEWDLWGIVRPGFNNNRLRQVHDQYPKLEEYINDLVLIRNVSFKPDELGRQRLAREVRNTARGGLNMRALDSNLTSTVEEVLHSVSDSPIGATHPPGFFNPVRANLPAIYHVLDPMEERLAWEHAIGLDSSDSRGIMHCGFRTPTERKEFMLRFLGTYDKRYGVDNYTRWLRTKSRFEGNF